MNYKKKCKLVIVGNYLFYLPHHSKPEPLIILPFPYNNHHYNTEQTILRVHYRLVMSSGNGLYRIAMAPVMGEWKCGKRLGLGVVQCVYNIFIYTYKANIVCKIYAGLISRL